MVILDENAKREILSEGDFVILPNLNSTHSSKNDFV